MEKSSVNRVYNIKVYKFGLVNSCVHTVANPEIRKKPMNSVCTSAFDGHLFVSAMSDRHDSHPQQTSGQASHLASSL